MEQRAAAAMAFTARCPRVPEAVRPSSASVPRMGHAAHIAGARGTELEGAGVWELRQARAQVRLCLGRRRRCSGQESPPRVGQGAGGAGWALGREARWVARAGWAGVSVARVRGPSGALAQLGQGEGAGGVLGFCLLAYGPK